MLMLYRREGEETDSEEQGLKPLLRAAWSDQMRLEHCLEIAYHHGRLGSSPDSYERIESNLGYRLDCFARIMDHEFYTCTWLKRPGLIYYTQSGWSKLT